MAPIPAVLCTLFLSLCYVSASAVKPSAPKSLTHITSRAAYPRDVVAEWKFLYSENDTMCPRTIVHLGFTRRKKGPIRIFHHRIIQDGAQCKNNKEFRGRRFRFFPSAVVKAAFRNRTTPYRIPKRLVRLLSISGPTRRAFRAANKNGDDYLIGYEGRTRRCGDDRTFRKGTTAFLLRPRSNLVAIKGIGAPITPGKRYLVMIPLFKRFSCVYSSEPRVKEPQTSAEPDESDKNDSGDELEAKNGSGSCFPATAYVHLSEGRTLQMKHLSVADRVQVAANEYAPVFMFTHKLRSLATSFRRIQLETGEALDVTGGHYIYANEQLITASQVKIGDLMPLANGSHARVRALSDVMGYGLYNPQTMHGDMIVNGIRVSTYTDAVNPQLAHTLLAPLRAVFRFIRIDASLGALNEGAGILQFWRKLLR